MLKQQNGFSLIELMVSFTIVGILASLALPAYMDFGTRAKMAEIMTLAARDKTLISEYRDVTGDWPNEADALALLTKPAASDYIQQVAYSATDVSITYVLEQISPDLNGKAFVLDADENDTSNRYQWACRSSTEADKIMPNRFLPASCR